MSYSDDAKQSLLATVIAASSIVASGHLVQAVWPTSQQDQRSPMMTPDEASAYECDEQLPSVLNATRDPLLEYEEQNTSLEHVVADSWRQGQRIVLDAGHGLGNSNEHVYDPGAVRTYDGVTVRESDVVFAITGAVHDHLTALGYDVHLTRPHNEESGVSIPLRSRTKNVFPGDIYLSIHANSFDNPNVKGIETYFFGPSAESESFAQTIQNTLYATVSETLATNNRGIKN